MFLGNRVRGWRCAYPRLMAGFPCGNPLRDAARWRGGQTNLEARVTWPRSKGSGAAAFENAEFGPDGKVIGDALGLLEREVVVAEEIKDAAAAGEFGGSGLVKEDVVVLRVVERVRRRF